MTDPSETAVSFDSARFRQVLGHFPSGVTVVTSAPDGEPAGLAVGSFCSVSLEPPLVLFCPSRSSSTFPVIRETGVFCVNILGEAQEDVSRVFAGKGPDKFKGIGWKPAGTGSPILYGALAWVDCRVETVHESGDHFVVIGRVLDLGLADDHNGPLLFYRGGYGRFES